MKKSLLVSGIVGTALIGGVAFAASPFAIVNPNGGNVVQPAGLTAPSNKPAETQETAPQAAQDAPEAAETSETPTAPSEPAQSSTAPESEPAAPVAPPAPVTVLSIVGSGVQTVVHPNSTFTCTYYFSDGTSASRPTAYTPVLSGTPAALCPEWE